MATVYLPPFTPESALFLATTFPEYAKVNGTNFPVTSLKFDAALDEAAFWKFQALNYGSGNLTVDILWYADTASSGDVVFGAAISAITPNTDSQDVETDGLATENTVTDSHLGTTGQRVHLCSITVSNLDSLANLDLVHMRIRRLGSTSGSDTMSNDACILLVVVSYSDT